MWGARYALLPCTSVSGGHTSHRDLRITCCESCQGQAHRKEAVNFPGRRARGVPDDRWRGGAHRGCQGQRPHSTRVSMHHLLSAYPESGPGQRPPPSPQAWKGSTINTVRRRCSQGHAGLLPPDTPCPLPHTLLQPGPARLSTQDKESPAQRPLCSPQV